MKIDLDAVLPDGISDETAAAVREVLAELLMWWDAHYLDQIRRPNSGQRNLNDPEEPWRVRAVTATQRRKGSRVPLTARAVSHPKLRGTRPLSHPRIGWDAESGTGRDVTIGVDSCP